LDKIKKLSKNSQNLSLKLNCTLVTVRLMPKTLKIFLTQYAKKEGDNHPLKSLSLGELLR
jgi:hypothetical protein